MRFDLLKIPLFNNRCVLKNELITIATMKAMNISCAELRDEAAEETRGRGQIRTDSICIRTHTRARTRLCECDCACGLDLHICFGIMNSMHGQLLTTQKLLRVHRLQVASVRLAAPAKSTGNNALLFLLIWFAKMFNIPRSCI